MNKQAKSQEIGNIGKIIVPKEIENIIDNLHKSVGSIEWSGVLFYKLTKGNINKLKDLEFTVQFIYPMNIGSHSYTEFEYSGEIMNAYELEEKLITYESGLIHTHHSLGAFFSGEDINEIATNAKHFNYYISLVVDFQKAYKCKIAFPSKTKTTHKYTIRNTNGELVNVSRVEEEENIIVGDLVIEFEDKKESPEWLINRVGELKEKKAKKTAIVTKVAPIFSNKPTRYINKWEDDDWWNGTINNYSPNIIPTKKKEITPKQFLVSLLTLDTKDTNISLEGAIANLIMCEDLTEDLFDNILSNNIEIIHNDLYGVKDSALILDHCEEALKVLQDNEQLFGDSLYFDVIESNLQVYAI